MKRKLLKRLLCLTICSSVIAGLFSDSVISVFAVSEETQNAIDEAEGEKEQLEQELKEQEEQKGNLEGQKATAEQKLDNLKAQYKSISSDLAALNEKMVEKEAGFPQKQQFLWKKLKKKSG